MILYIKFKVVKNYKTMAQNYLVDNISLGDDLEAV